MMTDQKYKATQAQLIALGMAADKLDCLAFLERSSLADTMGPILDPTLYRKAANNMQAIRSLAMAFQQVKVAIENLRISVLDTGIKEHVEADIRARGPRLV